MAWTGDRVETLTRLWKQGKSASQIATELGGGVSRNAVIGKIHRLGLSERDGGNKDKNKPKLKGGSIKKTATPQAKTKEASHVSNEKTTYELKGTRERKRGSRVETTSFEKNKEMKNGRSVRSDETKDLETHSEIVDKTDLDEQAIVDMLELEKKAKKLTLLELTERTCKWPIGDPATSDFWFCGHQAESGKPYCETHVAIAFQPVSTRRDRKLR